MVASLHLRPDLTSGRRLARGLALTGDPWLALVWLWPVALVLMQATVMRLPGFEVTVAVLVCHAVQLQLVLFCTFKRPATPQLAIAAAILIQALLGGLLAADLPEFARSFVQLANLVAMVLICLNLRVQDYRLLRRSIAVFCCATLAIALLIAVQFVAFNLLDDLRLARPLGDFSAVRGPGLASYVPHEAAGLRRPNGLFSEPSVAGWFMIFAAAVSLCARPSLPRLAAITALAAMAAACLTLSLTGVLGITVLTGAWLCLIPDTRRFKLTVLALGLGLGLIALAGSIGAGLLERAGELARPGTSGYMRFTGPFLLVLEALASHPLGYPIGQTDLVAETRYFGRWLNGVEANLDNMLLTIVLHFGVLGLAFHIGYLSQLFRWLVARRRPIGLLLLAVFLMMATTGAGWAHHSVLLIGYAILVGRYALARERAARERQVRAERRRLVPAIPPAPATLPRPPAGPLRSSPADQPRAVWLRPASSA